MTRETALAAAFVEIAASMVSGDVVDSLHLLCRQAVTLLDVTAAGVMVADQADRLLAVAASDEQTHLLEMFSVQHEEGPCLDVFRSGQLDQASTTGSAERWPAFAEVAIAHGYGWVCGIPLRFRDETLGALNLFRTDDAPLGEDDVQLGQALADIVTVSLLHRRESADARRLAAHLQTALSSRVLIEQAKGVVAQRLGIGIDAAFRLMRRQARDGNRRLDDIARELLYGPTAAQGDSSDSEDPALLDPPA